jgi:hypothetical protein
MILAAIEVRIIRANCPLPSPFAGYNFARGKASAIKHGNITINKLLIIET